MAHKLTAFEWTIAIISLILSFGPYVYLLLEGLSKKTAVRAVASVFRRIGLLVCLFGWVVGINAGILGLILCGLVASKVFDWLDEAERKADSEDVRHADEERRLASAPPPAVHAAGISRAVSATVAGGLATDRLHRAQPALTLGVGSPPKEQPVAVPAGDDVAKKAEVVSLVATVESQMVAGNYAKAKKTAEKALALDPSSKKANELMKILGAI